MIMSNALVIKFKKLKPREVICLSVKKSDSKYLSHTGYWSVTFVARPILKEWLKKVLKKKKKGERIFKHQKGSKSRIMGKYKGIFFFSYTCNNYTGIINI